MTDGNRYSITLRKFAEYLKLDHHFEEERFQIHSERIMEPAEMDFMYAQGTQYMAPRINNLLPELMVMHRLLLVTLSPQIGDSTVIPQYERNLLRAYYERKRFNVPAFTFMEIVNISTSPLRSCGFAPQIMVIIEKVTQEVLVKDVVCGDLKPNTPRLSVYPRGSSPPLAATSIVRTRGATSSSSSSGGSTLFKMFKSIVGMCRSSRHRQDVILENQCNFHHHMCLQEPFAEFDEEPEPQDPFASLTPTDWAFFGLDQSSSSRAHEDDDGNENDEEGDGDDDYDDDDEE
jgi:hypothetical protein